MSGARSGRVPIVGTKRSAARTAIPRRLPAEDEHDGGHEVKDYADQLWEALELEPKEPDRRQRARETIVQQGMLVLSTQSDDTNAIQHRAQKATDIKSMREHIQRDACVLFLATREERLVW
jgi:hypothetical protein